MVIRMKKIVIKIALMMIVAGSANATLVNGSLMTFTDYTGGSTVPADGNGSWFSVNASATGVIGISSLD